MGGVVGLIIAIVMASWTYEVVVRNDGQWPWLWAAGAFVFWPLVATIAGFKYNATPIMVVGTIGLCLIVVGILMGIDLEVFL